MKTDKYDSTADTIAHISRVRDLLCECVVNLTRRAQVHDASKLQEPEKSIFDEVTPALKGLTYGSLEYKGYLEKMKPALEHHYANNSHHPEHHQTRECNGCFKLHPANYSGQCDCCGYGQFTPRKNIGGMSLLDLLEMLCDWKAAGERHADGSMARSLELNKTRFAIGEQLQSILENTARELGYLTTTHEN